MIKNWVVTTKQIKKKEKGFINHINYLVDKNKPSHFHTEFIILNDKARNILNEFDARKTYRKENSLRGGGVSNYATSFVLNIPKSLDPQPTADDWKVIAKHAIKAIAEANNLDYKKVLSLSHCVVHDESKGSKNSHLNLTVSNVFDNEVVKGISQLKTDYAVKQSFNKSVKKTLGHDNNDYIPNEPNKNVPLHVARAEKATKIEDKIKLLKITYNHIKNDIQTWGKTFLAEMFKISEKRAEKIADNLNEIEPISKVVTDGLDDVIDEIEQQKNDAPDEAKISNKRKRKRRKRT